MLFKRFFVGILLMLGISTGTTPDVQGKSAGELLRQQYGGGGKNKAQNVKQKLMDPATHHTAGEKPYITPTGQSLYANPALCGQGSTINKVQFFQLSQQNNEIRIRYATDPYSGVLDRSFRYSGNYLCTEGVCNDYDANTGTYRNCRRLEFNGSFSLSSVSELRVCVDPLRQPQPPTFYSARAVDLLVSHYSSTGRAITQMDVQTQGQTATYFGGVSQCQGQTLPPQTKYYSNPYVLNDHALYYYHTCDPTQDRSCLAVKVFMEGNQKERKTCIMERAIGQPSTRICTPGQRIYPDGYQESKSICGAGDFLSFQSSFWLECSSDGKGYILKGWGYWEGSPCGKMDLYPPPIQVSYPVSFGVSFDWQEAGRLSVNRRVGGEAQTEGACVSDVNPMRVWIKGTWNGNSMLYEVRIDNAGSCNYFSFSGVRAIPEDIISDCPQTENCKVINEWWEDAFGRRIQVIENGSPVKQLTGCEEVLRDERNKVWTSSYQTRQSPPSNCNYPPKTCKTINGNSECRQWWRKIREYDCLQRQTHRPNLERVERVFSGTSYNSGGFLQYRDMVCGAGGQCEPVLREITEYVCLANSRPYSTQDLCRANCFVYGNCSQEGAGYRCAKTGQFYSDAGMCQEECSEPAPCQQVYFCPINSGRYATQGDCLASCNNCQESGTCRQEQRQIACSQVWAYTPQCPQGYTWDGNLRKCVASATCPQGGSLNPQTDRCEAQPQCPSGFTWNAQRGRCESPGLCPSGLEFDYSTGQCVSYRLAEGTYWGRTNLTLHEVRNILCVRGIINHNGQTRCLLNWTGGDAESLSYIPEGYVGTVRYNFRVCDDWTVKGEKYSEGCDIDYCYWEWWQVFYWGGWCKGICGTDVNNQSFYVNTTEHHRVWLYDEGGRTCGWFEYCPRDTQGTNCSATWVNLHANIQSPCSHSGASFDPSAGVCFVSGCPAGYSPAGNVCVASPRCPSGGVYDPSLDRCVSSSSCPSGSFGPVLNMCVSQSCPSGLSCSSYFYCPLSGEYNTSQNLCFEGCRKTVYVCSFGGEYDSQSQCLSACVRSVENCCDLRGYCTGNGIVYDVGECPGLCRIYHQCSQELQHRCSLTGEVFPSLASCESSCRTAMDCQLRSSQVELYRCSATLLEYESLSACENVCSGGGCSEVPLNLYVGMFNPEDSCQVKYCVVKRGREYEVSECQDNTCSVGEGAMIEPCKCADSLKSGFGIATSTLGAIYQALKDRECAR